MCSGKKNKAGTYWTEVFIHRFAPSPQTPAVLLLFFFMFLNLASDTTTEASGSFISQTTGWQRKRKKPLTTQATRPSLMVWREMPKTQYFVG